MISFWLISGSLVGLALAFVLPPLLRDRSLAHSPTSSESNLALYRADLAELETALHRGKTSKKQYEIDREELESRLLEDVTREISHSVKSKRPAVSRKMGYAIALTLPLASYVLYNGIGQPPPSVQPQPQRQMPAAVMNIVQQARNEPDNFEAQVNAAALYYQIQRYEDAIAYLLKANQLRPDDFQTLASLAAMNMESGHFDSAERWFDAALSRQPRNITILEGYCALLLHQGSPKAAAAIAQLGVADPTNQFLPEFRGQLSDSTK